MPPLRIFLDTTALKFAVQRQIVGVRQQKAVSWGGTPVSSEVTRWVVIDPTADCDRAQRHETRRLPVLAWLANQGRVELLTHHETMLEFWGLPRTQDSFGYFFGAPLTHVAGPMAYSRIVIAPHQRSREMQHRFFAGITHPRFEQLKRATGAYQGKRPSPPNELADAFHVFCAESAGADVFVTFDTDLINQVALRRRSPPKIAVALPTVAVHRARETGLFGRGDYSAYRRFRRHLLREGSDHPLEGLVRLSRNLSEANGHV